jgi:hypothetical protein
MMLLRPLALSKDGRVVMGTFQLAAEDSKKHIWVVGKYDGAICGFIAHATLDMMNFLLSSREAKYFDVEERERVRKLLQQKGPTWSVKSSYSLEEPSGWQAISTLSTGNLPTLQEPSPQRRSKRESPSLLTPIGSLPRSALA